LSDIHTEHAHSLASNPGTGTGGKGEAGHSSGTGGTGSAGHPSTHDAGGDHPGDHQSLYCTANRPLTGSRRVALRCVR
jgi:hypothetical protein